MNADGCTDSASVFVRVLQPVNPPNAFSPNGDGNNDRWMIKNIDTYPNATVQVFTRWGQQVFQSRGYQRPWDGTIDGKVLPIGTYYYIIMPGEGRKAVTGWVQLLR
jgi:gliding motility-associated-like protein